MYELFVGPPELDAEWDDRGIDGVNRFLNRFWRMALENMEKDVPETPQLERLRNKLVYDITTRLEAFSLNTVISGFMEYNNKLVELTKTTGVDRKTIETFVILLAPFAPHIAEELWQQLGHDDSVFHASWPTYDESKMIEDTVEIPVQVNGKTRAVITVEKDIAKEDALMAGKEAVAGKLSGNIVKEIYVPGRIVNFVVKG